jgi:hypothetical protein
LLGQALAMLEPNTTYVISFDCKSNVTQRINTVIMYTDATRRLTSEGRISCEGDETWHHVSVTLTTNDLAMRTPDQPQVLYFGSFTKQAGYFCVKNLKLEKGNQATAWTPAPEDVQTDIEAMVDRIWPVGSIYMSMEATDPATRFGGTWTRIQDAFLLAAGDAHPAGESGGEETHTLTEAEMPSHSHEQAGMPYGRDWLGTAGQWSASSSGNATHVYTTKAAGGGQAHNNMPPYLSVYVWRRIS